MKFVIIRHCETDWNAQKRLQGHTDIPLNERGREKARQLGRALINLGITRIVSSDLLRARETAEIVSESICRSVEFDRRLREWNFGSIEGMTREEFKQRYGLVWGEWAFDFRPFGGESSADVIRRIESFLTDMRLLGDDETCLVVGHGSSLYTMLGHLELPAQIDRGEYRRFEYSGGQARELEGGRVPE